MKVIKAIPDLSAEVVRRGTTGFVLAGGGSRRMGRDKAQLSWGSGTLLSHAVGILSKVCSKVFVVGAKDDSDAPAPVVADSFAGLGPLAGIHAALANTTTEWNLVLAVDLPLISAELLTFIREQCEVGRLAIVPRIREFWQPLCAVYSQAITEAVSTELTHGRTSIHSLLERLSAGMINGKTSCIRTVEQSELLEHGFAAEMFTNVNTPQDLERARSLAHLVHGD